MTSHDLFIRLVVMIFNAIIAEPEKKKWGNYKMILELQVEQFFVIVDYN